MDMAVANGYVERLLIVGSECDGYCRGEVEDRGVRDPLLCFAVGKRVGVDAGDGGHFVIVTLHTVRLPSLTQREVSRGTFDERWCRVVRGWFQCVVANVEGARQIDVDCCRRWIRIDAPLARCVPLASCCGVTVDADVARRR